MDKPALIKENPWQQLRRFTDARIALGRAGNSIPTARQLEFQLAHARARDAVTRDVNWPKLLTDLHPLVPGVMELQSQAQSRRQYLQRPDLGRQLSDPSQALLTNLTQHANPVPDTCLVIADGLSATAIEQGTLPLLQALLPRLTAADCCSGLVVCSASQARVALSDAVAHCLGTRHNIILIGERPGLSSPDSLGLYYTRAYTHAKGQPCTDADRNCISNIRPRGLAYEEAAKRLLWLMNEADALGYSGVRLKDDSDTLQPCGSLEQPKPMFTLT